HAMDTACANITVCSRYSMSRANRTTTKCNDGQYHDSCGVHAISWESMGLSQTQVDKIESLLQDELAGTKTGTQVLIRGHYKIFVDFLAFVPSEVWVAQLSGGNTAGTFVQEFSRPIACLPERACPAYEEDKLNSTKTVFTEGLDFNNTISATF